MAGNPVCDIGRNGPLLAPRLEIERVLVNLEPEIGLPVKSGVIDRHYGLVRPLSPQSAIVVVWWFGLVRCNFSEPEFAHAGKRRVQRRRPGEPLEHSRHGPSGREQAPGTTRQKTGQSRSHRSNPRARTTGPRPSTTTKCAYEVASDTQGSAGPDGTRTEPPSARRTTN